MFTRAFFLVCMLELLVPALSPGRIVVGDQYQLEVPGAWQRYELSPEAGSTLMLYRPLESGEGWITIIGTKHRYRDFNGWGRWQWSWLAGRAAVMEKRGIVTAEAFHPIHLGGQVGYYNHMVTEHEGRAIDVDIYAVFGRGWAFVFTCLFPQGSRLEAMEEVYEIMSSYDFLPPSRSVTMGQSLRGQFPVFIVDFSNKWVVDYDSYTMDQSIYSACLPARVVGGRLFSPRIDIMIFQRPRGAADEDIVGYYEGRVQSLGGTLDGESEPVRVGSEPGYRIRYRTAEPESALKDLYLSIGDDVFYFFLCSNLDEAMREETRTEMDAVIASFRLEP